MSAVRSKQAAPAGRSQRMLDRLGISASMICAVHCAVVPLAITVLPLFGLSFLMDETFEATMIMLSVTIGLVSLGMSYRVHRRFNPLLMMGSGALLLIFNLIGHESHSELGEALHPYLAVAGGLMIAFAHRINMRLCDSCRVCAHDHAHDAPEENPAAKPAPESI